MTDISKIAQNLTARNEFGFCGQAHISSCTNHPVARQLIESMHVIAPTATKAIGGGMLGGLAGNATGAILGALTPLVNDMIGGAAKGFRGK